MLSNLLIALAKRLLSYSARESVPEPNIIAISTSAARYLSPSEAINYIATLPTIKTVAVGVSRESHAYETFKLLNEKL